MPSFEPAVTLQFAGALGMASAQNGQAGESTGWSMALPAPHDHLLTVPATPRAAAILPYCPALSCEDCLCRRGTR